jgi:hypothetical protein
MLVSQNDKKQSVSKERERERHRERERERENDAFCSRPFFFTRASCRSCVLCAIKNVQPQTDERKV